MMQSRYYLQRQINMSGLGTENWVLVLLSSRSSELHVPLASKEHWMSSSPPNMIPPPATCPSPFHLMSQMLNYFLEFRRLGQAASHLLWIKEKGSRMLDSSTEDACVGNAFSLSVHEHASLGNIPILTFSTAVRASCYEGNAHPLETQVL